MGGANPPSSPIPRAEEIMEVGLRPIQLLFGQFDQEIKVQLTGWPRLVCNHCFQRLIPLTALLNRLRDGLRYNRCHHKLLKGEGISRVPSSVKNIEESRRKNIQASYPRFLS